ncbi:MAG: hypothetical protein FWE61_11455 [Micrococcales bacterium]|nr:hypothetical protein [Micrococcales bacterium]
MDRYRPALGVAVVWLVLATGCLPDDGSASPTGEQSTTQVSTPEPRSDIDAWVEQYTAAVAGTTTVHVVVRQEMVSGGETTIAHLEVDMSGTDRYGEVQIDPDGAFLIVVVGDTAYAKPDGGVWDEMPRRLLAFSELHINPAATITVQRVSITAIELVASEDVDGVPTDHYVITYDVAKRTDLPMSVHYGAVLKGDTITADLWVDAQMRPVRYESTIMVRKDMATGRVVVQAVYSGYGTPVTIEPPV